MPVSHEEVRALAQLARLHVSEEELQRLAVELEKILGYIQKLNELDTASVAPLYYVNEYGSVNRPDIVSEQIGREEALRGAPKTDGRYFHVPRVID